MIFWFEWEIPFFFKKETKIFGQTKNNTTFFTLLMVFVGHPTNQTSVAQGLFLRWVRVQSCSPDAPGIPKNASGTVGIPLKRGASGARQ